MRAVWLLALVPLAGCLDSNEGHEALLDQTVVVPYPLNAFVDVSLDQGELLTWQWTSDQPLTFSGRLRCDTFDSVAAEAETSGNGRFVGASHGCIAELLWKHDDRQLKDTELDLLVRGDGMLLQMGCEDGRQERSAGPCDR